MELVCWNKLPKKRESFIELASAPIYKAYLFMYLGLKMKTYLNQHYKDKIGKAKISGYCIKFKSLNDIDMKVLQLLFENELNKE